MIYSEEAAKVAKSYKIVLAIVSRHAVSYRTEYVYQKAQIAPDWLPEAQA